MKEIGRRIKPALAVLATVVVLGLAVLTRPTSGSHIDPVYVGYDASCADLAPPATVWHELRVAPVEDGLYADDWLTVSLDVHVDDDDDDDDIDGSDGDDSTTVDWSSDAAVDGVFVKGGPGGYFYHYVPATSADTGLTAPRRFDDDDDDDFGEGGDDDGHYDPDYILFCLATPPNTPAATLTPAATATPIHMTEQVYLPALCNGCPVAAGEPNDSCDAAYAIEVDTPNDFFPDDVHDWYRFRLVTARDVEVRLENFMPLEGQLSAYAGATCESAAFLRSNGDRATNKVLSLGRQPAGAYYIYVSNDGVISNEEPYRLIVEVR